MKKMNNKGFSLVELIIVIAIMAVLIVVLAPQYLKYVEKSRNSTDVTNATEIVTAVQVYASDPDVDTADVLGVGTNKITVNGTNTSIGVDQIKNLDKALEEAGFDVDTTAHTMATTCVSKTAWTSYEIEVTVESNGNVTFTYSAAGNTNAAQNFKDAMAGKKIGSGTSTP